MHSAERHKTLSCRCALEKAVAGPPEDAPPPAGRNRTRMLFSHHGSSCTDTGAPAAVESRGGGGVGLTAAQSGSSRGSGRKGIGRWRRLGSRETAGKMRAVQQAAAALEAVTVGGGPSSEKQGNKHLKSLAEKAR